MGLSIQELALGQREKAWLPVELPQRAWSRGGWEPHPGHLGDAPVYLRSSL